MVEKKKKWPAAADLWESNESDPLNATPLWGGLYIPTLSFEAVSSLLSDYQMHFNKRNKVFLTLPRKQIFPEKVTFSETQVSGKIRFFYFKYEQLS